MSKLVRANFTRLVKSTVFRLCMAFSAGAAAFLTISRGMQIRRDPEWYASISAEFSSPEGIALSGAIYLIFAAAVFVCLFLGTEYSDGTLRNKLIVGHGRMAIYGADLVTAVMSVLIMLGTFIGVSFGLGVFLMPAKFLTAAQIAKIIAAEALSVTSMTAIFTCISMNVKNKPVSAVVTLMLTFVMFFGAAGIYNKIHQPETVAESVIVETDPETGEKTTTIIEKPNPDLPTGAEKAFFQFLDNALPVNQIYQLLMYDDKNTGVMAVYAVIVIAAASGGGALMFRRQNIR